MNRDEILLKSNQKMISKQGKRAHFTDNFHALFGYILVKYRLSKKLCSNYRPEFAKWSIYRPAIILYIDHGQHSEVGVQDYFHDFRLDLPAPQKLESGIPNPPKSGGRYNKT